LTQIEPKKRTAPPHWWRFLFWSSIAAIISSIIVAVVSTLLSLGFGVISLFAGSLAGFSQFSLSVSQLSLFFLASTGLCVSLLIARPFVKTQFAPATMLNRVLIALLGVFSGVAVVVTSAAYWVLAD
jgi:fucose 4-O-acetylase-like acetyltransferase